MNPEDDNQTPPVNASTPDTNQTKDAETNQGAQEDVDLVRELTDCAALSELLSHALKQSVGKRPGRPGNPNWKKTVKLPISDETLQKLRELTVPISSPKRKVAPMQIAAYIVEQLVSVLHKKSFKQDSE